MLYIIFLFFLGWLAATISGAAGFGGALILLPILTQVVGVKEAIPILTIAQLFGNASRVYFGFQQIRWRAALSFSIGALPFAIIGSALFSVFPAMDFKRNWFIINSNSCMEKIKDFKI